VVDGETAARISGHYGEAPQASGSRIAVTVFTILGALLVGAGIILLLAHNWESLSRGVRAVLSFLPLLAAQAIALVVRRRPAPSRGALEGAALFLALTVAASIALVGQTYHIYGDLGRFLLAWSLLMLPVIYLFRSTSVFVLYLACVTGWCGFMRAEEHETILYWVLFLAALPHFILEARQARHSIATMLGGLGLSIAVVVGASIRLDWDWSGLWIVQYSAVFAALYLAGAYWFGEGASGSRKPLRNLGALGIGVLSFVFTFEDVWRHLDNYHGYHRFSMEPLYARIGGSLVEITAFLVLAIVLGVLLVRRRQFAPLALGVFPILAVAGYSLAFHDAGQLSVVLFNVYSFGAGVFLLISGIRGGKLGTANWGLIWMMAILVSRFLDLDISFVAKGVVFILLGTGFLVTNLILSKKLRRVPS
jgi:hypothetical protein